MRLYKRILTLTVVTLSFTFSLAFQVQQTLNKEDDEARGLTQTTHNPSEKWGQCEQDSAPIFHIAQSPLQQPPEMYSLQIPERSIVIQAYSSPIGRQIMLDVICKERERLKMKLAKTGEQQKLVMRKKLTVEGYKREILKMDQKEPGSYHLRFLSMQGQLLQSMRIVKKSK